MPEVMLVNPRKRKTPARKRRTTAKRTTTARRRPAKRRTRRTVSRYRRNPARKFNIQTFAQQTLMPSAVGAVGALGVDMALGFLPLPLTFKTGPMRPLVKGVAAVALGIGAGMVTTRKTAEQITAGGLTVVLYDAAKTFLQQQFPALPFGEYQELSYYSPGPVVESDRYLQQDMSAYMDPSMAGIDEPLEGYNMFDESLGAYMETDQYD